MLLFRAVRMSMLHDVPARVAVFNRHALRLLLALVFLLFFASRFGFESEDILSSFERSFGINLLVNQLKERLTNRHAICRICTIHDLKVKLEVHKIRGITAGRKITKSLSSRILV